MSPKKGKTTKSSLKKAGTMATTVAAGTDFLKRTWGEDQLNKVNAILDARDETSSASTSKAKAKPKLSKARTMQNTAKEAKDLLGQQILGDTRQETKRRQASASAKKPAAKAKKAKPARKPALKRLGTMAKTAKEGKAYVKRTTKKATGRGTKKSKK
ncbi:unnamed protein product [Adineta ricciae]|uniref:Uncharacterized protein n=1 Tax=Adineta ricciae TaxID=249248 RepID=A0A816DAJ4_ADIRI|nr:unnamed protein product [Adineta ricciae]CAF1635599.1 unnamed protein product [Adineta ricciae]